MKPNRKSPLLLAATILLDSMTTFAADAHPTQAALAGDKTEAVCHHLMTEKECASFLSSLATLPRGASRDLFLTEHTTLMRERDALCNCRHLNARGHILYPQVMQMALKF